MSLRTWWSRLTPRERTADVDFETDGLPMAGWQLVRRAPGFACWRDAVGDVVSLSAVSLPVPPLSDPVDLQHLCRRFSEEQRAGLVEVTVRAGANGACLTYVYKRLEVPAFKFFGVVYAPAPTGSWMWMVAAAERGTTGVREAMVADLLLDSGQLTVDSYRSSWARDPYEPEYAGVDSSTLRYMSDAVEYDALFPDHPLTKTRRQLDRLVAIRLPRSPSA